MLKDQLQKGFDAARYKAAPYLPDPLSKWANLDFHSPDQSRLHYFASLPLAELAKNITASEINGALPEKGAAIIAANHVHKIDPFIIHWLTIDQAHRPMRMFAKKTLQDPTAHESESAKYRRTQKDNGQVSSLIKRFEPWYAKGFAPYSVHINPETAEAKRENLNEFITALNDLRDGHMVGIFPQGTRKPKLDLLEMMDGVVDLARRSNAPIYPVGLNNTDGVLKKPKIINIGEPFYYKDIPQLENANPKEKKEAAKQFIAGKIAEQVIDANLKPAWLLKNEFKLTIEQIKEMQKRNPDLGAAVEILRMSKPHPASAEDAAQNIKEVDTHLLLG